ncbi:MAG: response regulator transcription factor [Dehalococcoidales bacterium]|jgi:DNA-binding NarL/FixJ family response regulator|nr:response regulator transcription factor [Dehalococcoidales bacterium]
MNITACIAANKKKVSLVEIKVLLADDHAVLREGMRQLLEREKDIRVIGEASDGEETVEMVSTLKPAVVLMDIVMPKLTGIEATRQIKQIAPGTCILILTAYSDMRYILGLLEAGASGYLLKSARGTEIIGAIRAVCSGESVLDPVVTRKLLQRVVETPTQTEEPQDRGVLSRREIEILRLASRGMSNKDIATELSISIRTVKAHLTNIFNKMGVACRTDAIVKGLKAGYIDLYDIPQEDEVS